MFGNKAQMQNMLKKARKMQEELQKKQEELKKQTVFKLDRRDSVHFEENTAPVNIAYAREVNDVAILPLGAIEQHGPH